LEKRKKFSARLNRQCSEFSNLVRSTFGSVSIPTAFLALAQYFRMTAWRLPGERKALATSEQHKRKLFPEREPPNSMICRAGEASNFIASRWSGV
jgi:hypothetical protein